MFIYSLYKIKAWVVARIWAAFHWGKKGKIDIGRHVITCGSM